MPLIALYKLFGSLELHQKSDFLSLARALKIKNNLPNQNWINKADEVGW